ncbi:MAG TPA: PAS domain-containing protein [Longimicrobium sp.]|nr:PAS domain-containing protein [Longimicrobium sp.]
MTSIDGSFRTDSDSSDAEHYRRQLETVAENATLALFIMDEHQRCTYMNRAAEEMTGFRLTELQGKELHYYVHHTRPDGSHYPLEECPIDQAFPQNMREQGEEVFVHKDGHLYPVRFTASPIRRDGETVGTIIEARDITAKRAREAALRQEQERYRFLAETIPAQVWTAQPDGNLDYVSARAARYFGIPAEQLLAEGWRTVLHPDDLPLAAERWTRSLSTGEPYEVEFRLRAADGEYRWHLARADAMRGDGGEITAWFGVNADVHDRKVAVAERDAALRAAEFERERLAAVFRHAPAFISTVVGPDHVFEMANPPYYQLVGHRDIIGKPVREALPEAVGRGFVEILDHVYTTGGRREGIETPVQLQPAPNLPTEDRFVNFVYEPLRASGGEVYGVLGYSVDVTEIVLSRQRVEEQAAELESQTDELRAQSVRLEETQVELEVSNEELQEANAELGARIREVEEARREADASRALLDAFFHAAPLAAGFVDPELRYRRINSTLASISRVGVEGALGRPCSQVAPRMGAAPHFAAVLESGEALLNVDLAAGEAHYAASYFPVKDADGAVLGVGMVALDVTEQRAAERAQAEQATMVDTLHRVGKAVAGELEVARIVQEVTDAATLMTGARFGAFFYNVLDEKGEAYTLYTISGVPREEFSRFPMPRNTAIFSPTFHGEGVVRSDNITRDARYGKNEPYFGMPQGHLPVTSYLAVPVISRGGEVLGGLFFGHEQEGVFTEQHERLTMGIAGWAAVAMDNAALYEAEHRARAEAERANRVKSEFLATMSHELRTPLNATIGYAELLMAGIPERIPDASQEQVRRIALSGRHLLELIEEILTFSRLEAGEERFDAEPVDLATLMEEASALTEPLALTKGIGFETHAPEAPGTIVTDHRKVRQILLNLLGNAVKFTDAGRVALTLEVIGDEAYFRVDDSGSGIAAEHLERIFDPFWQVEVGPTRRAGGTGLGLSVTRRLARLIGGEVEVVSRVGQGSTFTLRLPRAAVAAAE